MPATVRVKLFATLKPYMPDNAEAYPIGEATTVADLVQALALPQESVKLIFINSRRGGLDNTLKPGDQLGIFPPVGGG
jgi:molybdopterin converting factor small subunit